MTFLLLATTEVTRKGACLTTMITIKNGKLKAQAPYSHIMRIIYLCSPN